MPGTNSVFEVTYLSRIKWVLADNIVRFSTVDAISEHFLAKSAHSVHQALSKDSQIIVLARLRRAIDPHKLWFVQENAKLIVHSSLSPFLVA